MIFFAEASVVLGNLGLTCDRTDSTAFLVSERASSDFTRPMSSARNASGRFAKSLVAAAAVSVNEAAQGHRPVRMESRRRCLYAALVTMMESADFRHRNNPPHVRRLDRARFRCVLLQSQVGPAPMIVVLGNLILGQPPKFRSF